jgi:hypothetical protein
MIHWSAHGRHMRHMEKAENAQKRIPKKEHGCKYSAKHYTFNHGFIIHHFERVDLKNTMKKITA